MNNWRWYHPPILFPMSLAVLVVAYALLRPAV